MFGFGHHIRINRFGVLALAAIIVIIIYLFSSTDNDTSSSTSFAAVLRIPDVVNLRKLLISSIQAAQYGGLEIINVSNTLKLNLKSKGKTKEGANDPVTDADSRSHCKMKAGIHQTYPHIKIISEEDSGENCERTDANYNFDSSVIHDAIDDEFVLTKDVTVWIDPLDATQEFTEKLYHFVTTMVCVAVRGVPTIGVIHSPYTGETTWAFVDKGVSDDIKNIKKDETVIPNPIVVVSRSHAGDAISLWKTVFGAEAPITVQAGAGYKVLQVIKSNATAYFHSTQIKKWDICAGNAILNALGGRMTNLKNQIIDYTADGSPINDNGLLATLNNHNYYIKKLEEFIVPQR